MSWGRIDDGLHDHEKFMGFGPATTPREQWVIGLSWTHRNYRRFSVPGFVPADMPTVWAGSKIRGNRFAARLVERGLWETADGGWVYHDWLDYASPEECRHFGAEPPDPSMVDTKPRSGRTVSPATAERLREAGRRGGRRSGEVRRRAAEDRPDSPEDEASTKPREASEASGPKPQTKPKASQSEAFPKPEPEPAPRGDEASGFKPQASKPSGGASQPGTDKAPKSVGAQEDWARPPIDNNVDPYPPAVLDEPRHASRNGKATATRVGNGLLDEFLASYPHTLPRDEQKWASRQIERQLADGIDPALARTGLALLREAQMEDPDVGIGLLPKFVRQAMSGVRPGMRATRLGGRRSRAQQGKDILDAAEARLNGAGPPEQATFFPYVVIEGETA